ncbi:hypothetical protein B296_00030468, partial [Ensete ventricosum]
MPPVQILQIKSFILDASCITCHAHASKGNAFDEAGHQDRSTAIVNASAVSIGLLKFSPPLYINAKFVPSSSTIDLKKPNLQYLPPPPNAMPPFLSPPLLRRFFVFPSPFSPPRHLHLATVPSSTASMPSGDGGDGSAKKGRLRGLVFDMDGTLTVPVIDFGAMYRAVLGEKGYAASASGGGVDILHHIEAWPPPEQQRAYEIIAQFERQGLDRLQIMPGSYRALELCRYLDSRQIRRGLITRNVKAAVDIFHQRFGMEFIPALSREFRPYKPDPAPLLHICSVWGVPASQVMMIGDSLRDDV